MIVTEERNLLPKTLRRLNEETDDFDAWPVDVGRRHCYVRPDAGRHHHQDQEGQESKEAKADHDHQELTWSDNFCRAFIAHGSPVKRGPCAISFFWDSFVAIPAGWILVPSERSCNTGDVSNRPCRSGWRFTPVAVPAGSKTVLT